VYIREVSGALFLDRCRLRSCWTGCINSLMSDGGNDNAGESCDD
ncbi:uncharacterized protein METZ01_LOCUS71929, partial [marine metagenome]